MREIIPHSQKTKLPKDLHDAIKYSDLEAAFAGRCDKDLHLWVHFGRNQAYWMEERKRVGDEGRYKLVSIGFDPEAYYLSMRPWSEMDKPVVVGAGVYVLPRTVTAALQLKREMLRSILVEQVRKLTPKGWTSRRWGLSLNLWSEERHIQSVATTWTGLRQEPEIEELFPIAELISAERELGKMGSDK